MFQQITQTLGNMDGQYQAKTPVKAFVTNVDKEKYDSKTGKLKNQKLYLRAENGEIAEVYLKGNFTPLTKGGDWHDFLIWPFKPGDSQQIFLCCWIQNQNAQQAPQQPQQASQPPAQATPPASFTVDSNIRAKALDIAAKMVVGGKYDYSAMFLEADDYAKYIFDGTVPMGVARANPQNDPDF